MQRVGKIPDKIREIELVNHNYSCSICGQMYFVDVHHIKPRHEGGSHVSTNLTVLCPTCHRAAHKGVYSKRVLQRYRQQNLDRVEHIASGKSHLGNIQLRQIWKFIYEHCLSKKYPREKYLELEQDELYFIVFDLFKAGLIIDPNDGKPLLVSDLEMPELLSIEVVTNPFRLMFLQEWQSAEGKLYPTHLLVRVDVALSVGDLNERTAKYAKASQEGNVLNEFRNDLRRLFRDDSLFNPK